MISVREMELWTSPGKLYADSFPAEVGKSFSTELPLASNIFIALNSVPDEIDSENLLIAFEEGELAVGDFKRFCMLAGFECDEYNHLSACRFLEFSYGRKVAWIHLPESTDSESELKLIAAWTREKGLALVDPDELYCICV
ncbi:hypothetical protein KSF73_16875 [Burkholderiaceae bacterium DAT-1]|nr:hypothetical protein [Burkholderiaceae bacterium DAT-1]